MKGKSKNLRAFVSSCEKQKPITPRLRFPEFRGDGGWKELSLSDVSKVQNKKIPVQKLSITDYISTENLLPDFSGVTCASNLPNVNSVTEFLPDDILLANIRPYLKKAWSATRKGGASNDVIVFRSRDNVKQKFLSIRIRSDAFIDYVMSGAKGVKMPRGDVAQMKTFPFPLPESDEQQKIADCLGSLDDLITAHNAKLGALQDHKKGLLQKLFPAEGQTTPELRFPGFEGEWDQKYLGTLCSITTGKLDANAMVKGGKYRFYTCAREFYHIDKYAFDSDALLVSGNGANVGYIHHYQGKFNAYQRTYVLDNFSENILFMKFFLDRNLRQRIELEKMDGNTPYIVRATLSEMVVRIPHRHEQQKIANCLSTLDDQITTQTDQIAALKEHKKGLMQQLFPNPEGSA